MAKRSDMARIPKEKYRTPPEAVLPLLPHLAPCTMFIEPCAGDGRLARTLVNHGHRCLAMYDNAPEHHDVRLRDATRLRWPGAPEGAIWITNPPWRRDWLHPIIRNLIEWAPCWLLFDADWIHTTQSIPFKPYLRKIVSAGRIKWIEGTAMTSKDNSAWHYFTSEFSRSAPTFHGPEN